MTHRRNRQFDRAVREYQRENPGTTLEQARAAVTARASQEQGTPARIPSAPLPRPGETLPAYVQRVAAAAGTHRHRAMELLGLKPGTSATQRLAELTGRLPDDTVRALCAATGMTPAQARALTAPPAVIGTAAAAAHEALRRTSEEVLNSKMIRPGGEGKTRTSSTLALALALRDPRVSLIDTGTPPLRVDTDPQGSLDWPGPAPSPWILLDTPWTDRPLPADPAMLDALETAPSSDQHPDADPTPNA
ncbi:hypothetical protein PV726_32800 [Streptomyces europaeiscabiei]|uniref:TniQ family protein n=1 Tax=Streptomyces europaeiscabiei TaxID=146819 RepID=UPI0029A6FB66|nr:TniQ family protein [Streptomyces europaeiscabiei]MDX3695036.1 hypothetical protein [Streptomyces europaeiscabiei]